MPLYEVTKIGKHNRTGKRLGIVRAKNKRLAANFVGNKTGVERVRVFPVKLIKRR